MESSEFETTCPHCHRVNDVHANASDAIPQPGDISICWGCLGVSSYGEDLQLGPLSEAQQRWMDESEEFMNARIAGALAVDPLDITDIWNRLRMSHEPKNTE